MILAKCWINKVFENGQKRRVLEDCEIIKANKRTFLVKLADGKIIERKKKDVKV